MNKTPTTLIIMDGFGLRTETEGNAVAAANTPRLDQFFQEYAHTELSASGLDVGLPAGQMGNSEVGHTNIGAGRVVFQDLPRISKSIDDGDFFQNPAYVHAMDACKEKRSALHLMGLLSDGGVHSHIDHLFALMQMAKDRGLERVYIHAFLDGRDVSPTSGKQFFYKCLVAALAASVILIVYIALRFKRISGWSAGICAILALVHDLITAYGTFVIAGFEINSNFMAVLLTILGYSVNNTMVIYDRIRENQKLMDKKTSIRELVNTSISQTMRRSIRTSVTTISTMLIISIVAVIMQVDSILSFSIPLTVGLISGTYSSICIAPVVWVWWTEKRGKKTVADLQIRK